MTIIPIDFKIGQRIRIKGDFKNENEVLTDPSTVTFTITKPDETETAYYFDVLGEADTLTHPSTGIYYIDITIDQAGIWTVEMVSTGILETADWEIFNVTPTP